MVDASLTFVMLAALFWVVAAYAWEKKNLPIALVGFFFGLVFVYVAVMTTFVPVDAAFAQTIGATLLFGIGDLFVALFGLLFIGIIFICIAMLFEKAKPWIKERFPDAGLI